MWNVLEYVCNITELSRNIDYYKRHGSDAVWSHFAIPATESYIGSESDTTGVTGYYTFILETGHGYFGLRYKHRPFGLRYTWIIRYRIILLIDCFTMWYPWIGLSLYLDYIIIGLFPDLIPQDYTYSDSDIFGLYVIIPILPWIDIWIILGWTLDYHTGHLQISTIYWRCVLSDCIS